LQGFAEEIFFEVKRVSIGGFFLLKKFYENQAETTIIPINDVIHKL